MPLVAELLVGWLDQPPMRMYADWWWLGGGNPANELRRLYSEETVAEAWMSWSGVFGDVWVPWMTSVWLCFVGCVSVAFYLVNLNFAFYLRV